MHALKQAWLEGRPTLNGWLVTPCGYTAELFAQAGWDSVTVDLQHGVQDYLSMVACFQAMRASPVALLARVPSNEPGIVGKVLDGGASGVICPMVNTAEQAARFVAACRYPPAGQRSNGPARIFGHAPGAYQQIANAQVLAMPMIETREAVDRLDEILAVPGVDAVYVGPTDLAFSLGRPPLFDPVDATMLDLFAHIARHCRAAGLHAGIHCGTPEYARRMQGLGFSFTTIGSDASHMLAAATAAVAAARG